MLYEVITYITCWFDSTPKTESAKLIFPTDSPAWFKSANLGIAISSFLILSYFDFLCAFLITTNDLFAPGTFPLTNKMLLASSARTTTRFWIVTVI